MRVFMVAVNYKSLDALISVKQKYILLSYLYIQKMKVKKVVEKMQAAKDDYGAQFFLDSGAHSFQMGTVPLNSVYQYQLDYAFFLSKYGRYFDLYAELDVDAYYTTPDAPPLQSKIQLTQIEKWNEQFENIMHRKPIGVWHPNRGLPYLEKMLHEFPHIGISGAKEDTSIHQKRQLCNLAHRNNVMVHGFGCTKMPILKVVPFDTVDSATWMINTTQFGSFIQYVPGKLKQSTVAKFKKSETVRNRQWSAQQWKYVCDFFEKCETAKEVVVDDKAI